MNEKHWAQILVLFGILTTLLSGAVLVLSHGTPPGATPFEHYEMVASLVGGLIFIALGVGWMLKAPVRERPPGRTASNVIGLGGLVMLTLGGIRIAETLARPYGFEPATVLYYCIFVVYGFFMLSLPVLSRLNADSAPVVGSR